MTCPSSQTSHRPYDAVERKKKKETITPNVGNETLSHRVIKITE